MRRGYVRGWNAYVRGLRPVTPLYEDEFRLAAMVVRAHEDKTHPGAIIASMTIPWGYAVASDKANVGGYHLVWSRDLYEAASALMVAGDSATARRALTYLLNVQQKPDGSFPQNSWLDGRPEWPSIQMDEVAYPLILAWQLGVTDRATWERHLKPAADYVVAHGPATLEERWEEERGYSPSTIAAEIAGLTAASALAARPGAAARARPPGGAAPPGGGGGPPRGAPGGGVAGYRAAVEWRPAKGPFTQRGPATIWARMRYPLVADEETGPLERVLAIADSGNGASSELDLHSWHFINPELTVHLQREAAGEWICLDAQTAISEGGAGLATSVLSDLGGPVGVGAQSLLIARRRRGVE